MMCYCGQEVEVEHVTCAAAAICMDRCHVCGDLLLGYPGWPCEPICDDCYREIVPS